MEEGSRNGNAVYVSADRSAELFYSEREDDRRKRKTRRRLLPEDVLGTYKQEESNPAEMLFRSSGLKKTEMKFLSQQI